MSAGALTLPHAPDCVCSSCSPAPVTVTSGAVSAPADTEQPFDVWALVRKVEELQQRVTALESIIQGTTGSVGASVDSPAPCYYCGATVYVSSGIPTCARCSPTRT